jgi:hypothetical protein
MPTSSGSLALTAYVGDGAVLLAFSLDAAALTFTTSSSSWISMTRTL